jgi:hypothetical protein
VLQSAPQIWHGYNLAGISERQSLQNHLVFFLSLRRSRHVLQLVNGDSSLSSFASWIGASVAFQLSQIFYKQNKCTTPLLSQMGCPPSLLAPSRASYTTTLASALASKSESIFSFSSCNTLVFFVMWRSTLNILSSKSTC